MSERTLCVSAGGSSVLLHALTRVPPLNDVWCAHGAHGAPQVPWGPSQNNSEGTVPVYIFTRGQPHVQRGGGVRRSPPPPQRP